LSSLATSGTTPSRPVGSTGPVGATASAPVQALDGDTPPPNTATATAPSLPQQITSLIQKTINTLTSDRTANPLDALKSIESSPGLGSLLGQLNVSPQQFRSDILAAISQSADGNPSLSQAFQNFPAGQNLNTLA
jgi:hypothetical protein